MNGAIYGGILAKNLLLLVRAQRIKKNSCIFKEDVDPKHIAMAAKK